MVSKRNSLSIVGARKMKNIFCPKEKPGKILIIDDEEDIGNCLKSILERTKKFKVYLTTDPGEGLFLAKDLHPDLVILDIIMPRMGGDEVAERLNDDVDTKDIPVVFFTVLVDEQGVKEHSGKIGGHPFIPKTIGKEELISRIEALLKEAKPPR